MTARTLTACRPMSLPAQSQQLFGFATDLLEADRGCVAGTRGNEFGQSDRLVKAATGAVRIIQLKMTHRLQKEGVRIGIRQCFRLVERGESFFVFAEPIMGCT